MKKLTLVLVEDEKIVLKELQEMIDWDKLGIELVGCAEDGEEGENLIRRLEPDIVLTDIRLPGKDGLEMLASAPVANAIILSGHTDYQYMKTAIRLSVFDYLQKPVDDEELEETLGRLAEKIRDEESTIEELRGEKDAIRLPDAKGNHTVEKAICFMKENFRRPIGLQEVAESVRISENHLSAIFKENTGINFLGYLNALRMNEAIKLLSTSNLNVQEIAESTGFPTPGYFTKLFKKYTGKTPTQYRDGS